MSDVQPAEEADTNPTDDSGPSEDTSLRPALQAALDEANEDRHEVDLSDFKAPEGAETAYPPGVGPHPTIAPGTVKRRSRAQGNYPNDQVAALKSNELRRQAKEEASSSSEPGEGELVTTGPPTADEEGGAA